MARGETRSDGEQSNSSARVFTQVNMNSIRRTGRGRQERDLAARSPSNSRVRCSVQRVEAQQGKSEVQEPLEQPVELGLVSDETLKYRVPVVATEAHPPEYTSQLVAELALNLDPVGSAWHMPTVTHSVRS